jgi:hypothetical protein
VVAQAGWREVSEVKRGRGRVDELISPPSEILPFADLLQNTKMPTPAIYN